MKETKATLTIRRSDERGHFNFGWLDTRHTFSFADYYDPRHMRFRSLRVINQDTVEPGQGFGTHPHRDMEILTYVYEGRLGHKDSMGNGSVIGEGEFQKMSAGTGIEHSEFNPSSDEPVRLLQIWILPDTQGLRPSYHQAPASSLKEVQPGLRLVAEPGAPEALPVQQNVRILHGTPGANQEIVYETAQERGIWIQLVKGRLAIAGGVLSPGDGAAVEDAGEMRLQALEPCDFLLFDLK